MSVTELNDDNNNVTIETNESENGQAGDGTPEDATPDYDGLLKKQNETIETLIEQNKSLTDQLTAFVRNNGSRIDGATKDTGTFENNGNAVPDNYVPLKDLGKAIGSRDVNY